MNTKHHLNPSHPHFDFFQVNLNLGTFQDTFN